MDIKKALSKIFKIFVPVSLVVGSLIFSLSNVKDFKPVHADSGYSLTIDGGSTISFTQQDPTTYTAEINENVRRYTEITFYDGSTPMLYSDTCYAEVSNTNNLFNDYDGSFMTKYGIHNAIVTLTINSGNYIFQMSGMPASLKEKSTFTKVNKNYTEKRLYCLSNGTNFAANYNDTNLTFDASPSEEPLYVTLEKEDSGYHIYFIDFHKYLYCPKSGQAGLTEDKTNIGAIFPFSDSGTITGKIKSGSTYTFSCAQSPSLVLAFGTVSIMTHRTNYFLYEVGGISSIECEKKVYSYEFDKTKPINLDDEIETKIQIDACTKTSSKSGIIYSLLYNDEVVSLENRSLNMLKEGALTVRVGVNGSPSYVDTYFIITDNKEPFNSPITVSGADQLSNLDTNLIMRPVYDYDNDYVFLSSNMGRINTNTIGNNDNARELTVCNMLPCENIKQIEVKGSYLYNFTCYFSNDPNFATYVEGKEASGSSSTDEIYIPKDGNSYNYFRLYVSPEIFGGVFINLKEMIITFGQDYSSEYAKSFNEDFCAICELVVIGDKGLSDIISEWNIQKAAFIVLKEKSLDSANKLKAATYADEDQDIADFALKYDYIYGKYHSSLDDFVERNPVKLSQGMNAYHSLSEKEDQSVLIIVISASTLLLISTSTLLILLKKKKKH